MLATASLSGVLGVWDLSSYRLRQECKHPVSSKNFYPFTPKLQSVILPTDSHTFHCN